VAKQSNELERLQTDFTRSTEAMAAKLQLAEGEKAAYKVTVTEQGQHTHPHSLTLTHPHVLILIIYKHRFKEKEGRV
jgi:hypothetical protein